MFSYAVIAVRDCLLYRLQLNKEDRMRLQYVKRAKKGIAYLRPMNSLRTLNSIMLYLKAMQKINQSLNWQ